MVRKITSLNIDNEATSAWDKRVLQFTLDRLPWLIGAVMFVVYGLTLNHWVSSDSISLVAGLEGLKATAGLTGPVTYLVTYPFGWLPAAWIPLAVNLFTAFCAALCLSLLARLVALMPHDLTKFEVEDRIKPLKLLANHNAWIPPVLTCLACGFQLSFWQNAITATGEMINLLMFAFVILSLLEYNATRNNSWLLRGALVFGLAMANDWAMTLFLIPCFLALIWVKNLFVFQFVFVERVLTLPRSFRWYLFWQIPGCWLAGLSSFLLLPAIASLTPAAHLDFWTALKHALETFRSSLDQIPTRLVVISLLVSLGPIFLLSLQFYQFIAGFNKYNFILGSAFFHLSYGFLLLVGAWTMFDSPLSARGLGLGTAELPMTFLGAVSIGYFTGHFLVIAVISKRPVGRPRTVMPADLWENRIQTIAPYLQRGVLVGVFALGVGIPAALVYKNLPDITVRRSDPCGDYVSQLERALPPKGGVLVGNDAFRLAYVESALIRSGKRAGYLLLDIGALEQSADYLDFVRHSNPGFDLNFKLPDPAIPDKRKQIPSAMLQILSRNHAIYSLTPAPQADSIAEFFDFQLHGLIYVLRRYETDETFARPIPAEFARDNETFWRTFETRQLPELDRQINPLQPLPGRSMWESLWNTLQFWPEPDHESVIAGGFYAEALNDWGVALQRTGKFAEAKHCFDEALELNAHSAAAQINRKFNADYLANRQETMKRPPETAASMNEYRDWRHVLRDGAVDEPNFCYMLGAILADNQLYRPAIAQIQRVTELAPAREDPYVTLAQLFGTFHDFPNVLRTTDKLLAISPTNDTAVLLKANALFELKDYPNSISFADRHLATVPADTAALLLKAAAYGQLLEYSKAISVLDQVLALNPTNAAALLGQGEALRRSGEYAAARRDFNVLVQTVTNSYPAYFNLAAMADAENDRPAAITNYEMFLKFAPPNTPEIADAEARLKVLRPDRP